MHGGTQNNNEALNAVIWKKCPKAVFTSRKILEIGVNLAILSFNDGAIAYKELFELSNIRVGQFTLRAIRKRDNSRIKAMHLKSSVTGIQRRKKLRSIKKGYSDKETELENQPIYETGCH